MSATDSGRRGARPARATTLAEVARSAGVSLATASKALNGRHDVSERTRGRVLAAAKRLRFYPNQQARSLMSGRTGSVGVLTTDLEGRFVLPLMIGLEEVLQAEGSVALLVNGRGDAELRGKHLEALLSHRVDGIVAVGEAPEPREPLTVPDGTPIVYAYGPSASADDVSVVADFQHAGRLAVAHLLERGCTRLGFVPGPSHPDGGHGWSAGRDRRAGAVAEMAGCTSPALLALAREEGSFDEAWGWRMAARILRADDRVDGLVCADDRVARGAIDLLRARGIEVGAQVAVIGMDNWFPFTESVRLPQSSVDMNLAEVGRVAGRAILGAAPLPPGEHTVEPLVVARRSTER